MGSEHGILYQFISKVTLHYTLQTHGDTQFVRRQLVGLLDSAMLHLLHAKKESVMYKIDSILVSLLLFHALHILCVIQKMFIFDSTNLISLSTKLLSCYLYFRFKQRKSNMCSYQQALLPFKHTRSLFFCFAHILHACMTCTLSLLTPPAK